MEQVERLARMLGESPIEASRPHPITPPTSVWETRDEIIVAVEMPGVSKDGLHVECRGRLVWITGQPRNVRNDARLIASEHALAAYQRIVPLPEGTTAADVDAQINDGLLELRIRRKVVPQEARDIPVR